MTFVETELGFEIKQDQFLYFFGKKSSSLIHLQSAYPYLAFTRIKQTHSKIVLNSTPRTDHNENPPEGDAHWTNRNGHALLIATADCLPVLMADPASQRCAAIHAGWRGIEQRILPEVLLTLKKLGSHVADLQIALGPHIGFESFEVQQDVGQQLIASSPLARSEDCARLFPNGKMKINLCQIAQKQLQEGNAKATLLLPYDTMTDPRFHSHRRDRENAGRQLSFIARVEDFRI